MSDWPSPPFNLVPMLEANSAPIQILDVGAMLIGPPCYTPLLKLRAAQVTGFEPNPAELARLQAQNVENCTWLPYILGDGKEATFYNTGFAGCSSLYQPNPEVIDLFETLETAPGGGFSVVNTEKVQTRRLDDVEECPDIDFMKIDVQGGELDVLRNGLKTIQNVTVIQTEVEFLEVYKDQPLFGDVQKFLAEQGFVLHKFVDIGGRCFRPFRMGQFPHRAMSQVLWADAVFVRDFSNLKSYTDEQLVKAALVLHEIFISYDLVLFLLKEFDERRNTHLAANYMTAIQEHPIKERQYMNLKEYTK